MKVLIVEDNHTVSQALHNLVSQQGWQSHLSHSCESAMDFLRENSVDIILLDILLPDKKGFEVLEMLFRQGEETLYPKVLIMSGFVDKSSILKHIPKYFKENCIFLKKPIDETALLQILKDIKVDKIKDKKQTLFDTFFEKHFPTKSLDFYLPEDKTFDSKYLIPVIFITHLKKFTGELKIMTNKQDTKILVDFFRGNIIKLVSKSKQSFFGNLLVEHGLCLQEDIQALLEDNRPHQLLGKNWSKKSCSILTCYNLY